MKNLTVILSVLIVIMSVQNISHHKLNHTQTTTGKRLGVIICDVLRIMLIGSASQRSYATGNKQVLVVCVDPHVC